MPDGVCVVMCRDDESCNDDENNIVNKCVKFSMEGYRMDVCSPGCKSDSDCRSFGFGYSLVCHKNYNDKSDVCAMGCQKDEDCMSENAKCSDSRCVPLDYEEESDTDTDADTEADTAADTEPDSGDTEDTVSDEEAADDSEDDMTFDDDQPKKKKSSGCSVTTL